MPQPGNPQSLNRYAYVTNNPLRYTDPSGHYTFEENPDDSWVYSNYDPAVRSQYWYTHPGAWAYRQAVADAWSRVLAAADESQYARVREAAQYIRQHNIELGVSPQNGTGMAWFNTRTWHIGLYLPENSFRETDPAQAAELLPHELDHLRQGLLLAPTVMGELLAWQADYEMYGGPWPRLHPEMIEAWQELAQLDPYSLADLTEARHLMRALGGSAYRIDLAPTRSPFWDLPYFMLGPWHYVPCAPEP